MSSDFDAPSRRRPQSGSSAVVFLLTALVLLVAIGVGIGGYAYWQHREEKTAEVERKRRVAAEQKRQADEEFKAATDRLKYLSMSDDECVKEANRSGIGNALKALGLDKRGDLQQLKINFVREMPDSSDRSKAVLIAVKIGEWGEAKLTPDEKAFVLLHDWFFRPRPEQP